MDGRKTVTFQINSENNQYTFHKVEVVFWSSSSFSILSLTWGLPLEKSLTELFLNEQRRDDCSVVLSTVTQVSWVPTSHTTGHREPPRFPLMGWA